MYKRIIGSILYYFRKINYKVAAVFSIILLIFFMYISISFFILNRENIATMSAWDIYAAIFINNDLLGNVLIFFSLYYTFSCFQDCNREFFVQIRVNKHFNLFTSKIISIFVFNLSIVTISTILSYTIGKILIGGGSTWRTSIYSLFYSPVRIAFYNIITYSCYVTFLSQIIGVLFVKIGKSTIPVILTLIYFAIDKFVFSFDRFVFSFVKVRFLKYISLSSYTIFNNRAFYLKDTDYLTVKESVILSVLLMVFTYSFISITNRVHILKSEKI